MNKIYLVFVMFILASFSLNAATGTIAASHEFVTEFPNQYETGNTTISWNVKGCLNVLIYLEMDENSEILATNGMLKGSMNINYILRGHKYRFSLFSANGDEKRIEFLDEVTVYGGLYEKLSASMYTVPVNDEGNGSTKINWEVKGCDNISVYVKDKEGIKEKIFTGAINLNKTLSTGSALAPWIKKNKVLEFRLYESTNSTKSKGIFLDSIEVSGTDKPDNYSIGFNGFPLFIQYLGISQDNTDYKNTKHLKVSKAMAKKSIKSAAEIGTKYFRTMVSGFYSPALVVWENDPDFYWAAMNKFVADLKASNIKLIPSLAFNIFQFPDYCNETTSDYIRNPNSTSFLKGLFWKIVPPPLPIFWLPPKDRKGERMGVVISSTQGYAAPFDSAQEPVIERSLNGLVCVRLSAYR